MNTIPRIRHDHDYLIQEVSTLIAAGLDSSTSKETRSRLHKELLVIKRKINEFLAEMPDGENDNA